MDFQLSFNFITFFLISTILLTLLRKWRSSNQFHTVQRLPPGPWKLPFIGNMHLLFGSDLPHHTLRDIAKKHGPLIHLKLGEVPAIVSSPRLAKEIMKTHDLSFASRPDLLASRIICNEVKEIAFSPYGDYWRQMRKICILELLSAEMVRSFATIRQDEVSQMIISIQGFADKPIDLREKVLAFTSSVICRSAFGKVYGREQDEFIHLVKEIFTFTGGFDVADLFPSYKILHALSWTKVKFRKLQRKLGIILDKIIEEHKENLANGKGNGEYGQEDPIDVLLRVKESGDLRVPINDNNIKAMIFLSINRIKHETFSARIETSSTTVEWAMSEMMKNPNVMVKAQNEIRQAFKGKKTIDDNDIQELRYLKLVIKEALRLHPPVPLLLPRESREECEIDGYTIPISTKVLVNVWAIGRDAEYWPDPNIFQPERFEHSPIDFTGNHFEYTPFGTGRTICPAISFGLANIELPLALLLYHFDWKLSGGLRSGDLDMTEPFGLTAIRKNSLHLIPEVANGPVHPVWASSGPRH